jgi:hypothetical protein
LDRETVENQLRPRETPVFVQEAPADPALLDDLSDVRGAELDD